MLDVPLQVDDLVHAAKVDDAVARALIAKRNVVIEAVRAQDRAESKAEGRAEGRAEGKAEALLSVLGLRNLSVDDAARACILGERDLARLERWLSRAMTCTAVAEPFREP